MIRIVFALCAASALTAGEEPPHKLRPSDVLLFASMGAMAGGSAADALSSWRGCETNPILRSGDGRFETRAVIIKSAILAGVVTAEVLIKRKPGAARASTAVNFLTGTWFGGNAARNGTIHMTGGTCHE